MSVHGLPFLQDEEVLMERIFRDEESTTPDALAQTLNIRAPAVRLTNLPPDMFAMVSVINRFNGSMT